MHIDPYIFLHIGPYIFSNIINIDVTDAQGYIPRVPRSYWMPEDAGLVMGNYVMAAEAGG